MSSSSVMRSTSSRIATHIVSACSSSTQLAPFKSSPDCRQALAGPRRSPRLLTIALVDPIFPIPGTIFLIGSSSNPIRGFAGLEAGE